MKTPNPIELAVAAYLASIGVKVICNNKGFDNSKDWKADKWLFTLKTIEAKASFSYKTGTGHRVDGNPAKPHVAGLIYSLVMELDANQESFKEWCGNFGYSDDSIAAKKIYNACKKNADKFNKLFTQEQREHLQELLQDY